MKKMDGSRYFVLRGRSEGMEKKALGCELTARVLNIRERSHAVGARL